MPKLLTIVGPTGSGKTPVSLLLAEHLDGEIVSADSRQIYKHLDIGTAKPTNEERRRIRHHFIDILSPLENYNAGEFGANARRTIREIFSRGKQPILVGGSGLYIKSVVSGLFDGPAKNSEIRNQLEERLKEEGSEALFKTLERIDPESARRMDPRKERRIIRALEVYYLTGTPISIFHEQQSTPPPFEIVQFGFEWEREVLYGMINERTESMLSNGLIHEVKELHALGFGKELNALNTVGYKEIFEYLDGNLNYINAIDLIKRNTRRFAKRQLTWFRADTSVKWIELNKRQSRGEIAEMIAEKFAAS